MMTKSDLVVIKRVKLEGRTNEILLMIWVCDTKRYEGWTQVGLFFGLNSCKFGIGCQLKSRFVKRKFLKGRESRARAC